MKTWIDEIMEEVLHSELLQAMNHPSNCTCQLCDELNSELDEEVVDRKSRAYISWIQQSLNGIMGAGLVVDGIYGPKTKAAIRSFQRARGLTVDGTPGPKTEAALIAAGARAFPGTGSLPAPSAGQATLAGLDHFSKAFIRQAMAQGQVFDCADLAIEIWIRFAHQHQIPIQFKGWYQGGWAYFNRQGIRRANGNYLSRFPSVNEFVRVAKAFLGARSLQDNTEPVPSGHRNGVTGDVFLWKYQDHLTGKINQIGHTQIFYEIAARGAQPNVDQVRIVQGSLPAIVPKFEIRRAPYFTNNRSSVIISGRTHTGIPILPAPRRFKGFIHLK